tara:strand:+ start:2308 stop:2460 length:153 start_codon:yes stop_codon:yes gene_type:complete
MNKNGTAKRLPCRGCLPNCRYFSACNGYPWNMQDQPTLGLIKKIYAKIFG